MKINRIIARLICFINVITCWGLNAQQVSYYWSNGATTPSIVVNPEQTTTYYLTMTQNGIEFYDSLVVIVNSPPEANITGDTAICEGFNSLLQANSGYSYLWSTGEFTQSIVVSPSENSVYSVQIIDSIGCQSTDQVFVSVIHSNLTIENVSSCEEYTWNGSYLSQSGTYTWFGTNISGCDSIVTLNLILNPITDVSFDLESALFCDNMSSVEITGGMPSGGIYSGLGMIDGVFNPSEVGVGQYQLVYSYTDENGCVNSDSSLVQVSFCTDIARVLNSNDLLIWPNPFKDFVLINFDSLIVSEKFNLEIIDASGRIIFQTEFITEKNPVFLELPSLDQGLYTFILTNKNNKIVRKLIR